MVAHILAAAALSGWRAVASRREADPLSIRKRLGTLSMPDDLAKPTAQGMSSDISAPLI